MDSLHNTDCIIDNQQRRLVRVTTRAMRPGEVDGKDYRFITVEEFKSLLFNGEILEYEKYSGDRFYGTCKTEIVSGQVNCSIITPLGLIQLVNSGVLTGDVVVFYCTCSIKNQILRYVNRTDEFTINDKLEMCDRLARDEGMFKGLQNLFDLIQKSYCTLDQEFKFVCVDTDEDLEGCQQLVKKIVEDQFGVELV